MADNKLTVEIVISDNGTAKIVQKNVENVGKAAETTTKRTREASKATDELNYKLNQGVMGTSSAARSFSKLNEVIGEGPNGLVSAYATLAANAFAVSAAFNALREAKQTELLFQGLEIQGARTGKTLSLVADSLQQITKGGLSSTQAMQITALGTAASFTRKDIEGLVTVANDASIALGRNLADSTDRIIKGVTKLEPELLDELGIMTKLSEAYEKYSLANNKTVASLTALERRQALLNAVQEEGALKFGGIADAVGGNVYDQLASTFDRLIKSFLNSINAILEVTGVIGALKDNIGLLSGVVLLFGSTIVPALVGSFANISGRAAKTAQGLKEIAAEQKKVTEEALSSSNKIAEAARQRVALPTKEEVLPTKVKAAIPSIQAGDLDATNKSITTINRSLAQYESAIKKIDKAVEANNGTITQQQQTLRAEKQTIVANLIARRDTLLNVAAAEKQLADTSSKFRADIIRDSQAQAKASSAAASASAFEAASSFRMVTAFKEVASSSASYKESLEKTRELAIQNAKETGQQIPQYERFHKTAIRVRTGIFGLARAFGVLGTAMLAALPFIGAAISLYSLFQELYDKFFRSDEERQKIKAYKDLATVLDSTTQKVKELKRISEEEGNAGKRAIQAITIRSNAIVELADSYSKANQASINAAKAEQEAERIRASQGRKPLSPEEFRAMNEGERTAKALGISFADATGQIGKSTEALAREFGRSDERTKSYAQSLVQLRDAAPELYKEFVALDKATLSAGQKQILLEGSLNKAKTAVQNTSPALEDYKAAVQAADTAQQELLKSFSVTTPFDKAYESFSILASTTKELSKELENIPDNPAKVLENMGNVLNTLPTSIKATLESNTLDSMRQLDTLNEQRDSLIAQRKELDGVAGAKGRINTLTREIKSTEASILSTSKTISDEVQKQVSGYADALYESRLLSIQGQSQIALAQAKLSLLQRQGTLTAQDVKRQMEAENNIIRLQAQQLEAQKGILETEAQSIRNAIELQKIKLKALSTSREQLLIDQKGVLANQFLNLLERQNQSRTPGSSQMFTAEDEKELKRLENIFSRIEKFDEGFNAAKDRAAQGIQDQIDLLDKQLKIADAQVNNVAAQQEAILTRLYSGAEIAAEQAKRTIENNAENNSILNETLKLTESNKAIVANTNDLFEGRNSQLTQELRTLRTQADQRKRDAILEKATAIARLENQKAADIAAGGKSEAVAENQLRIDLLKDQLNLQLENNKLVTMQDIAQKALNSSFTFGLEKQQEALEIIKEQVDMRSTLLEQEKDIAITRAKIEAKKAGGELSPQAQQAIELNFARRELNVARQTFELKMASIDAQYDLLEAQKLATASELQMRLVMLEEVFKRQEGGITPAQQNTIDQIRNASEIFSTRTYDAARALAKAQEKNSLTLLELRAEELSIFESGANTFASKVVNATKQAATVYNSILNKGLDESDTVSPLEKAVSIVKPDLVNLKNSLDTNVVSLREELTKTISSLSGLNISVDGLVEAIRKEMASAPRSSEDVMKMIGTSIIKPVEGRVTSGFKTAGRPGHDAVDLRAAQGTPVVSPISGKISFGQDERSGYFARIVDDTGKIYTSMSHLSKMYVDLAKGTGRVTQGQVIGLSGGTPGTEGAGQSQGPHVHWKLRINGVSVDPMGRTAMPAQEIPVKIVDTATKTAAPVETARSREVARPVLDMNPIVKSEEGPKIARPVLDMTPIVDPNIDYKLEDIGKGFENVSKRIGAFSAAGKIQIAPFIAELSKLGPDGELGVAIATGMFNIMDNVSSAGTKIGEQLKLISSNTLTEGQKFESYASIAGAALSAVAGLITNVASITKANSDAKIAAIEKEIAVEQKRDGKSAESVAKLKSLEKKKDDMARKSFNTQKKLMLASAIISTAAAVAQTLGSPDLPWPVKAPLAAAIGALGLYQVGIISKMQYEGATAGGNQMPTTVSIGKRSESVDLAKGPNANAGSEVGFLRGAQGTGSNASNFRTIGSAYGGELMRGYGNRGFVVGEKGPEVITPETPITVTPADSTSQAQSINASFNIQALDASGVQDILVAQKGNIIKMLREASNASGQSFMEDVNVNVYTRPSIGKL